MLKNVGYVLCLLVVVVIARIVGGAAGREAGETALASRTTASVSAELQDLNQVSRALNVKLPEMIDKNIRLDSTRAGPGRSLSYIHSLPAWSSTDLDFDSIRGPLAKNAKPVVCGTAESVAMMRAGVTIRYIFNTNDGVEIARASFSNSDCHDLR